MADQTWARVSPLDACKGLPQSSTMFDMSSDYFTPQEHDAGGGPQVYGVIDPEAARIKQNRDGRCFLALDGGGERAYSMILILEEISNRLIDILSLEHSPPLCDYLDMIVGVGVGGYLGLLTGRLGLTVPEVKKEYAKFESEILSRRTPSGFVDEGALNSYLKAVVEKHTGNSETSMYDPDSPINHCKTFVISSPTGNLSHVAKFRSYEAAKDQNFNCTIWQAARATLALPDLFPRIEISQEHVKQVYLGGAMGLSNPSSELIREFELQWKDEKIAALISIGAGHEGVIQVADSSSSSNGLSSTLNRMATDCERVALCLEDRFRNNNIYFRLNVEQGLQRHADGIRTEIGEIMAHTKAYLQANKASDLVDELVESLSRDCVAPEYTNSKQYYKETMDRYKTESNNLIGQVQSANVRSVIEGALTVLDSLQKITVHEMHWISLAKCINDHLRRSVGHLLSMVGDSSADDVVWDSMKEYFGKLESIHKSMTRKLKSLPSRSMGIPTHATFISESIASLEQCAREIDTRKQSSLVSDIHKQVTSLAKSDQDAYLDKILKKLSDLDPDLRHLDVRAKRCQNTGRWLLSTHEFQKWEIISGASDCRALCGFGSPGAGKTIACSTVIDHLRSVCEERGAVILWIYSDFRDQAVQTFEYMIRMLTKQLLAQMGSIPEEISSLEKENKLTLEDLQKAFPILLGRFRVVYICIDALDECEPKVRMQLLVFINTTPSNLRLFCTARHNVAPEVTEATRNLNPKVISMTAHEEDIRIYLTQKIAEDPDPCAMNDSLKQEIITSIASSCHEIFLLATLQVQFVLERLTIGERRNAVRSLPTDLSDIYVATLDRIKAQSLGRSQLALRVLNWVYLAKQHLTLDFLRLALTIQLDATTFDIDYQPSVKLLLDCCQGLVVVEAETRTVRLAHFTVHEYLDQTWHTSFPSGHRTIADACLSYLTLHTDSRHQDVIVEHWTSQIIPFTRQPICQFRGCERVLDYISDFLGTHLSYLSDPVIDRKVLAILNGQEKFWLLRPSKSWPVWYESEELVRRMPLHWAARENLISIASQLLLPDHTGVHRTYESTAMALSYASECDHYDMIKLLLCIKGIDVDVKIRNGITPLAYAAVHAREELVRLLLDTKQVNVNSRNHSGGTPLQYAAERGHEAVVQLLLATEHIQVDLRDVLQRSPLSYAADGGHGGVVKLLLENRQVDVNATDNVGKTPLSYASTGGYEAVVKLLLENEHIYVDSRDDLKQSPLSYAAEGGHGAVVKLLLETGRADVNSTNNFGKTALSLAADRGHESVVKYLLATKHIQVDSRDILGQTPLSYTARRGYTAVVKLLLETKKIDVNLEDDFGRTAISYAAQQGHKAVVRLLLCIGHANVASKDKAGRTPLDYAYTSGDDATVKILIEAQGGLP